MREIVVRVACFFVNLAIGLIFWFWLLWRNLAPARRDPQRRGLVTFFLIAAAAIPVFYLPALFFDGSTHYTIADTWLDLDRWGLLGKH